MALEEFLSENSNYNGIFMETAHPAKFGETVEESLGESISIPQKLAEFSIRDKIALSMGPEYADFKVYLLGL